VYRIEAGSLGGHQGEGDHGGEVQQLSQVRSVYRLEAGSQGGKSVRRRSWRRDSTASSGKISVQIRGWLSGKKIREREILVARFNSFHR
jgi:hypothetical protein